MSAVSRFAQARRWLTGPLSDKPTYTYSRWVFLRLLALVYLIAFVSIWVQYAGLFGSHGILPAQETLAWARQRLPGASLYRQMPTLCWFASGDTALAGCCAAGAVLSLVLLVGLAPIAVLVLLWLLYLSLVTVGGTFFSFQWDTLLLETGFLAIFVAPGSMLPQRELAHPVPRAGRWLVWWLAFRLMFASGIVKVWSGDRTWADWTALEYHYWTQPLPPFTAYYFNELPAWWHKFSCGVMYVIEIGLPFLIVLGRRLRLLACGGIVFLQLLIMLSGNYGFFNVLSITICLSLVDDYTLLSCLPRRLRTRLAARIPRSRPWFGFRQPLSGIGASLPARANTLGTIAQGAARAVRLLGAAVMFLLASVVFAQHVWPQDRWWWPIEPFPQWGAQLIQWIAPFRSVNDYGLFRVMTTTRDELILEGSRDGSEWLAYEFRYKPGRPDRRPRFVAPHQPRLDWQMWFVPLGPLEFQSWLLRLMAHQLHGTPEVLALLAENPFADAPPKYIRAVLYRYRFASPEAHRAHGLWWERKQVAFFTPPLMLEGDRLVAPRGWRRRPDGLFEPAAASRPGEP